MNVYIVRHGQVPHNALKQYNTTDEDLTDLGIRQAEELRDKIKNMNFDVIICSPLNRAKHTAKIINSFKKLLNIFTCTILNSSIIIPIFFSICHF